LNVFVSIRKRYVFYTLRTFFLSWWKKLLAKWNQPKAYSVEVVVDNFFALSLFKINYAVEMKIFRWMFTQK